MVMAIAVIFSQTFPSKTGDGELLVRLVLWIWVAVNTSTLVTLLVNLFFKQVTPAYQFKKTLQYMLRQIVLALAHPENPNHRPTFKQIAEQYNQLKPLFLQAVRSSPEIGSNPDSWESLMMATLDCYRLAALLQPEVGCVDYQREQTLSTIFLSLSNKLEAFSEELSQFALTLSIDHQDVSSNSAVLREMELILTKLKVGERLTLPEEANKKKSIVVPDALTNPIYLHFTLKTMLASLLCYVFYLVVDWDGIHTCMLTCVIVAQPGLGPTLQKSWLRIIGGLIATFLALFLMVYVQPHIVTIVGLLVMVVPVFALCAWVAAGSERIAYVGTQMNVTFVLGFLSWFGPVNNLDGYVIGLSESSLA